MLPRVEYKALGLCRAKWNMVFCNFKDCLYTRCIYKRVSWYGIALGFIGEWSNISSIANVIFDVTKSRIQGPQPVKGQVKYRWCFANISIKDCLCRRGVGLDQNKVIICVKVWSNQMLLFCSYTTRFLLSSYLGLM